MQDYASDWTVRVSTKCANNTCVACQKVVGNIPRSCTDASGKHC